MQTFERSRSAEQIGQYGENTCRIYFKLVTHRENEAGRSARAARNLFKINNRGATKEEPGPEENTRGYVISQMGTRL